MTAANRTPMRLSPVQHRFRESLLGKLSTGVYEYEQVDRCLCGSTSSALLATEDRFGIPVGTVLCRSCGLCRTSPRLAAKNLPSFYNEVYHGLHQGITQPDPASVLFRVGQGRAIHSYLNDLLPDGELRVAEIGCGTGSVLREFQAAAAPRAVMLFGCEFADSFVAVGRAAGTDIRGGGPETLRESAPFDIVIMSHVAEHFPRPVEALREVLRLGHPGTLYYVEVPGIMRIHRKPEYGFRFDRYLTLAHTYHFTLSTLAATMARAGYEIVRGDEEVRSVFKAEPRGHPALTPDTADQVLDYLHWLDRSWRVRISRARHEARPFAGRILRKALGARLYRKLRRLA
ncbi:MAG: class I SAM-dependent methyltransferase [Erythrobacter sp.]|nr:class I SAM-dependent methyltransferase [Erythrobacter sp.]